MRLDRGGNFSEITARSLVRIYIMRSKRRPTALEVVERAPQMSQRVLVRLAKVDQAPKELFACFPVAGGGGRVFIFTAAGSGIDGVIVGGGGAGGWQITAGDKRAD